MYVCLFLIYAKWISIKCGIWYNMSNITSANLTFFKIKVLKTYKSEMAAVEGIATNTPALWMVPTSVRFHSAHARSNCNIIQILSEM